MPRPRRAAIGIVEELSARPALGRAQLSLAAALRRLDRAAEADRLEATARRVLDEIGLLAPASPGAAR